jgi:multicomponent Na+:H+ antiporter subunit E
MSEPLPQPVPLSAETKTELRAGRDARVRAFWRRAPRLVVFLFCFARELILANITMAKIVLFQKREDLAPDFIEYDTTGLSPFEIVVLTHCITLTPGTTSVELSDDETRVVVHALDARDAAGVCLGIKNTLERPLLAWTR